MEEVRDLMKEHIASGNHFVANAAHSVIQCADDVKRGKMTDDEFHEIMNDVLDVQRITNHSSDIKSARQAEEAFNLIKQLLPTVLKAIKS